MKAFPKPLTAEEERDCLVRYQGGDEEARRMLIEYNLRLVAHIVKKYQSSEDDMEELISIGTIGLIKITGIPDPLYTSKLNMRERYWMLLERKEAELLELTCQAEEYIQSIPKSELRIMFRLYYIDGLTWVQVAHRMNGMFPNRRIKYTEDNCWRRNQRFFENVGSCQEET